MNIRISLNNGHVFTLKEVQTYCTSQNARGLLIVKADGNHFFVSWHALNTYEVLS